MADLQTTVAVNIGSQRVRMAVFEVSKAGGLTLKSYDSENIIADPALDATRPFQVRVAIADLASRLKVGKVKVRYALSGQSVFTRFVKLPPLKDDNIGQLVTFEARQHVPFPLEEVVWDYELIEGATEKEALIAAIKGDSLDEINSSVTECGLSTAEVDVAPMALYNAFCSTYGHPEEPVLLIDIGAKTSNLLYIEGKRFFTRAIGVGGASITAAIAKEYGVTFLEAENQKVTNGLVALGGGHTEQLEETLAALAIVIRNALSRLPAEIARTTNYYRSQHGGSAPKSILLAGGGANLPYTLEFLQEKLNLPVSYFNPVSKISIGDGVDPAVIQQEGHMMGELVGLGLRSVGKSAINIDLVPQAVEKARTADRKKPFFITAAAVALLGMGGWAVCQHTAAKQAAEHAKSMEEQKTSLAPLRGSIEGLLKKEAALRQIADGYTNAESDHVFWIDLLMEVREAFASDVVWLTSFEPLNGYDPLASLQPKETPASGKNENGVSLITAANEHGEVDASFLAKVNPPKEPTPAKGKPAPRPARGKAQEPAAPKTFAVTANAVRLKGFWRDNPKEHNVVSELLKKLREHSNHFRFVVKDAKGQEIQLSDEKIIRKVDLKAEGKPEDLAWSFEIILPLERDVLAVEVQTK